MAACAILLSGMSATGIYAASNEGLASRYPVDVVRAVGNLADKRLIRRQHFDFDSPLSSQPFDQSASRKVMVIGDSHAVDLFDALYIQLKNDPSVSVRQLYFDDSCFYVLAKNSPGNDELSHNLSIYRYSRT